MREGKRDSGPATDRWNWKDYGENMNTEHKRIPEMLKKVIDWRKRHGTLLVELIDIVVLFLLAEGISRFTSQAVYFKSIDVRLIFVFIIATMHGFRAGIIAALLECVVLVFRFHEMGVYNLQLFYNVENWIPFVLYIVTGAISGYYTDLRRMEKESVERENQLQREKYLFLNGMYQSSLSTNEMYRKQILSFDESYGKVYSAVCNMDCPTVREVCEKGGQVLEEMLENSTAAIYALSPVKRVAKALPFFDNLPAQRQQFAQNGDTEKLFSRVLAGGEWINLELLPEAPIYAVPVAFQNARGEKQSMLIVVWDAEPEQLSEYYVNRIRILAGLMRNALEKAALREMKVPVAWRQE